jgi:outer membrane protein
MLKTLIVAACLAAAAVVGAQDAAPKPAKLAVIDMERVTQESLLGKSYSTQIEALNHEIEAEQTKKRTELQKLDNEIKALSDDLEKQGALLSDEAADKKRAEIVRKNRERDAFVEDGRADIQRMQQKAQNQAQALNNEFQTKIRPYIEQVAKAQGIDILLDGRQVMTINKTFDISNEVIVKVDDAERASKPAGAAAKPAGAAAPKPAPAPKPTAKP